MKLKVGDEVVTLSSNVGLYNKGQIGVITLDRGVSGMFRIKIHEPYAGQMQEVYVSDYKLELSNIYNSPLYQALK